MPPSAHPTPAQIDVSNDHEVDLAEFVQAVPLLEGWGVAVRDPVQEFRAMNANGGGKVLFHEFAGWALKAGLNIWRGRSASYKGPSESHRAALAKKHGSLDEARRATTSGQHPQQRGPAGASAGSGRRSGSALGALNSTSGLSALVHTLPTGRAERDREARAELFERLDVGGIGALSFANVDVGLRSLLDHQEPDEMAGPPADLTMTAIAQAFQAYAQIKDNGEHCVSKSSFRLFLCHLKWCDTQPTGTRANGVTNHGVRGQATLQPIANAPHAMSGGVGRSTGSLRRSRSIASRSMPATGLLSSKLRFAPRSSLGIATSMSCARLHPIGGSWPMFTAGELL